MILYYITIHQVKDHISHRITKLKITAIHKIETKIQKPELKIVKALSYQLYMSQNHQAKDNCTIKI